MQPKELSSGILVVMNYCVIPGCFQPQNPDGNRVCQSCGSKLLLKERYRPLQLLGQGGFGRTFLAIDQDLPSQPHCVVKQLCINSTNSLTHKKATELFHREATRLEELGQHPQIPDLLAHFEQNRWLYLVQEWIDGQTLDQEMSQQPFTETKIWQVLHDLLPVLQFIHDRHVIHRDIKPSNLMRRQNGQLVLIDFGVAKQLDPAHLETGTIVGTAEYMAPEQGQGKAIPASDLYSLGVTCLHLLTQVAPSDLYDAVYDRWVWRDRLPPNMPRLSQRLGYVLDKLVQRPISQRFKFASEVLATIERQHHAVKRLVQQAPATPPVVEQGIALNAASFHQIRDWLSQPPVVQTRSGAPIQLGELQSYLIKGKWQKADQETWALLCQLTGKPVEIGLHQSDIDRLPCDFLWQIDHLWTRYSQGRFGFSVQTQIYITVEADYGQFCDRVGWPTHNPPPSTPWLTFSTRARLGHLPSRRWAGGSQWWKHAEGMAIKLAQCSLNQD
jgi:serine/threonine protein kinase